METTMTEFQRRTMRALREIDKIGSGVAMRILPAKADKPHATSMNRHARRALEAKMRHARNIEEK